MRYSVLLAALLVGCGCAKYESAMVGYDNAAPRAEKMAATDAAAGESAASLPDTETLQRKMVYTVTVDLVVEDFSDVPAGVEDLVDNYAGALISDSEIAGSPGSPRHGRWTIRVPVDRYEKFVAEAQKLGEFRRIHRESEDRTDEYYDIEASLENKRSTRDRLLKLKEKTDDQRLLMELDEKLDHVQVEINKMQGRLDRIGKLVSLTTVHLTIDEIKDYVPEESVGYGTRLRRAVEGSLGALWETAQAVSIGLIAALPWILVIFLVFILLPFFILRFLWRLLFRRKPSG